MKLQFLGHACFLLDDGVHKVLTDPFLTGAGRPEWAEKVDPDVIFVTHGPPVLWLRQVFPGPPRRRCGGLSCLRLPF